MKIAKRETKVNKMVVEKNFPYKTNAKGRFYALDFHAPVLDGAYTCREEFYYDFLELDVNSFFFEVAKTTDIKKIIDFLVYFQTICKIPETNWVKIIPTTDGKIIGIVLGKFWCEGWMRKDLLTALIRAALCKGKTFNDKIKNCEYLDKGNKELRKCLDKFIGGFQSISGCVSYGDYGGWQDTFAVGNIEHLIKKNKKNN